MKCAIGVAWNPEWILRPLALYIIVAAGIGFCVYLFIALKAELAATSRRDREKQRRIECLESSLAETRAALQALEADLRGVEQQTGMLVAPAPAPSGLNLSKRTQVLRMHRTGQDSAGIAAALLLPLNEVNLLIKVHRITMEQL